MDQPSAVVLMGKLTAVEADNELHEGERRILKKLRNRHPGDPLRVIYRRPQPGAYVMWDLMSQAELDRRGYKDSGAFGSR